MFDEQNSKCLANNVCPFGRSFKSRPNGQKLANISNFACQEQCSSFWPLHIQVLDKHVLLVTSKNGFGTLTSKVCLSSNACHGGQTHKHVRQAKFDCLPNNVSPFGRGFRIKI